MITSFLPSSPPSNSLSHVPVSSPFPIHSLFFCSCYFYIHTPTETLTAESVRCCLYVCIVTTDNLVLDGQLGGSSLRKINYFSLSSHYLPI